jgi:hypothetical protein
VEMPELHKTKFSCVINNKEVIFDFSDGDDILLDDNRTTFKFHCQDKHKQFPHILPFSPVSFYDWEWVLDFIQEKGYNGANSDIINSSQRPYANALERRIKVQSMLKQNLGNKVDTNIYDQKKYWDKCLESRLSVLAPGNTNFMVDRSHMQLFALGCPVITTKLPEYFPYWKQLEEGKHYIKCADDYRDVISIIQNTSSKTLKEIGANAKEFFFETSTPAKIAGWIEQCL